MVRSHGRFLVIGALLVLAACGHGGSSTQISEAPIPINDDVTSVFNALQTYYLYPQNIPPSPAAFATVSSLVAALNDPFTFLITPPQAAQLTTGSVSGSFGLNVARLSTFVYVNAIDPSGPAWGAGLRRNDVITAVDGVAVTASLTDAEIANAFAPLNITVSAFRGPSTQLGVSLTRASFTTTSVEDESIDTLTHYVRIGEFVGSSINPGGPLGELQAILQKNPTQTRWVIDLRWDTGGFLLQAAQIADLFIPTGTILTLRDKTGFATSIFNAAPGSPYEGYSIVVLVNGQSASASEVLAQSLHVLRGVKLVGTQTFGKGVSQRVFQFPDGGQLLMVSFQMFDANNFTWQKIGLAPDVNVPLDPVQLQNGVDSQLQAALSQL
jgi:carboxyl-terminal processing protease